MSKTYTQEEFDMNFERGYDKGRYLEPSMYEVMEKKYYSQQKLDQQMKETELAIKIMDIDKISDLEKELKEVKDKYIKLIEEK